MSVIGSTFIFRTENTLVLAEVALAILAEEAKQDDGEDQRWTSTGQSCPVKTFWHGIPP